jgi:serine-type D-Ala-D-Ala carboxypeptidase/endopeptidase (penicillin-binding protein 4)
VRRRRAPGAANSRRTLNGLPRRLPSATAAKQALLSYGAMRRSWRPVLLILLLSGLGCATRPAAGGAAPTPARAATSVAATSPIDRLRTELASTLDSPTVSALWAVKVQSLETGEVLYEQDAHRLVMPASNMKVVTMAVAAERLGWDYRFPTTIETAGTIENGALIGDLVVVGHGDPTISDRGGSRTRVFEAWADRLRALGITRIDGRIVGDDNAFDDDALGEGWAWDDLWAGYAAPMSALQFNENIVSIVVRTPGAPGDAAEVSIEPGGAAAPRETRVTIGPPESAPDVRVWRQPFDDTFVISGTVPKAERDYVRTAAMHNPTRFYVTALRDSLIHKGIAVQGRAFDVDDLVSSHGELAAPPPATMRRVLLTHQSPPLSEIGVTFMKVSQNLFGETLLTTLGLQAGVEPCPSMHVAITCRGRAVESGRKVYEQVLGSWGIPASAFIVSDGSGLSRYDFLTADLLTMILRRMARDPRHAASFEATLPIMGRDGTLGRRMRGTKAEGAVRAKTGSIANVRALSGYLATADGERVVFSIIANNFKAPSAVVDAVADQAVERLLNFHR